MLYIEEKLNRKTGDLVITPVGDYVTVTELGERFGVGSKKVRSILYHMGFLQREGRVYRLPWKYVHLGYGKRIDKPRSGKPFDVISPLGQELIEKAWDFVAEDLESDLRKDDLVVSARTALSQFQETRLHPMTTQESVSWLLDNFEDIQHNQVAGVLDVDEGLVSRYAKIRSDQKKFWKDYKSRPLCRGTIKMSIEEPAEACGF